MATTSIFVIVDDYIIRTIADGESKNVTTQFRLEQHNEFASAIAAALAEVKQSRGTRVGIALPSRFFYQFPIGRELVGGDLRQQKYALEEHLPIDAEQMAMVLTESNDAVVLDTSYTSDLLRTLYDNYDIAFDSVVATNLITALTVLKRQSKAVSCLIIGESSSDLVSNSDDGLEWQYFPGTLQWDANDIGDDWCIAQVEGEVQSLLTSQPVLDLSITLGEAFGGKNRNTIELLNFADQAKAAAEIEQSETSPMEYLVIGAAIAILLIAIGLALRASSIREQVAVANSQVRKEYKKLFPGERLNTRLLGTKLENAERFNGLVAFSNTSSNTLGLLSKLLQAIPSHEAGCRFNSIEVLPDRILIAGRVDAIENLDRLKNALTTAGFSIGTDQRYDINFLLPVFEAAQNEGEAP